MKRTLASLLVILLTCSLVNPQVLRAQDANQQQTAASKDASDWGLLGLIGLLGLLGLKKKESEE